MSEQYASFINKIVKLYTNGVYYYTINHGFWRAEILNVQKQRNGRSREPTKEKIETIIDTVGYSNHIPYHLRVFTVFLVLVIKYSRCAGLNPQFLAGNSNRK